MPEVKRGAVTMKIINKTSITSTNGVTLISDMVVLVLYFRFKISYLNISLDIITNISSEKTSSLLFILSNILLNLL